MDLLKSIFKGDKVIWIIFLFLCLISITEVFSAASTLTYKSGDHWGPITQHSIILMVGAVIVVLMHNIPYKWFQVFPVFLLPASAILLILVMMMERINGAARWMTFMGIQFQPSEIAKMAVIIVTAFILSKGQDEDGANPKAFKRIMIITGVICLLIAPENLSTAALLFGVVFLMMFIGRVSAKRLLMLTGSLASVGIVAVTFLLMTKNSDIPFLHRFDTWRARIEKFTSDEVVPAAKFDIDKDAQIAHARIAVATSNVIGKGPGNSVQRDFLSQAFFRLHLCHYHRGTRTGRRSHSRIPLHLSVDTCRTYRKEMRPYLPRLPHHQHSPAAGVAGHLQHDGGRGTGSRNRATAAAYQQRRYFDVDKLRLYRHDTECEPVHRQAGRTESARCPNYHAGGNRQRERKHLQRSAKRCRADSQDAEQRCRI